MTKAERLQPSFIPFSLILVSSLIILIKMVAPFLIAVITGGISSVLTYSFYRHLLAKGLGRVTAAATLTLLIVILIIGPILTLIMMAVKQGVAIANSAAFTQFPSSQEVFSHIANLGFFTAIGLDESALHEGFSSLIQSMSRFATTNFLRLASEVPQVALQGILAVLACFFFLLDGPRALQWLASLLPMNTEIQSRIKGSFRDTAIAVIWASMAAAAAQAVMMLLGFWILRIPAAFLAGGATFIFAWVPLLGSFPVWGLGIVYLLNQGSYVKAIILLIVGICTSIIDNFVRPLVLKGRSEMHPMVSLIAIFGGIEMFGIVGVFFGPILVAVVLTLLQIWPVIGRESGLEFPDIEKGVSTLAK